jgi:hypothetical protein
LSAEDEIRRTMGLYIQAHDRLDIDTMVSLFAEDSLLVNAAGEHRGRSAIRQFYATWRAAWPPDRVGKLMCGNSLMLVHGGIAEALTDVVSFQVSGTGPWVVNSVAQYADKFEKIHGQWQYAEKRAVSPGDLPPGQEWTALVSTGVNRTNTSVQGR